MTNRAPSVLKKEFKKNGTLSFYFFISDFITCIFNAVSDNSISTIGRFVKLFQIQCLVAVLMKDIGRP